MRGREATLAVGVHPSSGQSQTWSDPVLLSNSSQSAWFPDIAVDGSGRIHVVWSASEVGSELPDGRNSIFDLVMYSASEDGVRWTTPMDIIAALHDGGSYATRPSLEPLPDGSLVLSYRDRTSVFFTSASSEDLTAKTLQRPQRLSTFQSAYFSEIVSDADGGVHFFHTENVPEYPDCPVCFHLFYRRSLDGGALWSSLLDISRASTGAAKPQAVVDAQGNLHVVWEAGAGGDLGQLSNPTRVMYTRRANGELIWSNPIAFVGSGDQQKNVAIGEDGAGQLVVVWLSLPEDRVYYQVSSDQGLSWSMPQPIPGVWGGWSVYSTRLDDYDTGMALRGRSQWQRRRTKAQYLSGQGWRSAAMEVFIWCGLCAMRSISGSRMRDSMRSGMRDGRRLSRESSRFPPGKRPAPLSRLAASPRFRQSWQHLLAGRRLPSCHQWSRWFNLFLIMSRSFSCLS